MNVHRVCVVVAQGPELCASLHSCRGYADQLCGHWTRTCLLALWPPNCARLLADKPTALLLAPGEQDPEHAQCVLRPRS